MASGDEDRRLDPWLLMWSMRTGSGISVGLCNVSTPAVGQVHAVDDRRRGGDQVGSELASQPLLDDFEVDIRESRSGNQS